MKIQGKILKIIILFIFNTLIFSCNTHKNMLNGKQQITNNFKNVTRLVGINEFETIKEFILKNGDKMTFRNFDNNNPHYKFKNIDAFLGADIGQANRNNNPEISYFNQLTISTLNSNVKYFELIIIRKGDLKKEKSWINKGMKEEQIYLIDNYNKGLVILENELQHYLKEISRVIKGE